MQLVRQMKKRFSATVCETATVMIESTDDALRELVIPEVSINMY